MVLEKALVSSLDCKEIQPVHPKGDKSWMFIGRTDAKAETPVLWPPHAKSWLIGKDLDAGRDWGQEEKGTTEDEMAGWTVWTWVWVNSGSWWWTGRAGVLWFMGLQRVRHDWATELNWLKLFFAISQVLNQNCFSVYLSPHTSLSPLRSANRYLLSPKIHLQKNLYIYGIIITVPLIKFLLSVFCFFLILFYF